LLTISEFLPKPNLEKSEKKIEDLWYRSHSAHIAQAPDAAGALGLRVALSSLFKSIEFIKSNTLP